MNSAWRRKSRWEPQSPTDETGWIITSHKLCSHCGSFKTFDSFYVRRKDSVRFSTCKECRKSQQEKLRPTESYRMIQLRARFKRRYGITLEERDQLLAGGCSICGTKEGRLFIDHDHATGKVRGVLCHHHNSGIGYFKDSILLLGRAANYLAQHLPGEGIIIYGEQQRRQAKDADYVSCM